MSRIAACRCGRLRATVTGEPVRVSVCHCHACQQRTGSAFSWQARWPERQVAVEGEAQTWQREGDEGGTCTYRFCPNCGSTVFYTNQGTEGLIAIPLGAMAGQDQPAPRFSVYEERLQPWLAVLGEDVEHME
ncbi:MAG TPA: GFA family protein [Novosphingobium sp.]|nr:GFA family protein [Novosphingobium sp.]